MGIHHLAFTADDLDDLKRKRWLGLGYDVLDVDYGWLHSIYTQDPDGAQALLCAEAPARSAPPRQRSLHKAKRGNGG